MFGPYQSAATAQAADGHAYAVDAAGAEGTYQTAVAAARRAYQQAAAPIENQFALDVYQAEAAYQRALAAQDPNAWTQYQADLQAAAGTRQTAIQPLLAAQQAALVQAERDRTTALADAQRDRAQRLADREQTYTQGYGVANRGYLSGLAGVLWDLDYDLAPLDESYQNAVAAWDAQRERDYAQSQTLRWSNEQDAENDWSQAAGQAQADLWRAEYLSQTAGVSQLDYQLNSPWSDFQRDLASAKRTWWNSNEPAYLDWIDQTGAADTAYQQQVNAAYLGRTGDWTAADVDYTHDVAAAARQRVEDRADEQYDYLTDQASRSYTYVDQYAQSRHDARLAWAAAERWSRLGQDDSGAPYDYERYYQDLQAAQDAFQTATDSTRREYRTHRATGEAHRQIRSAEIDLQYVEDVAGALVDWTADVEKSRRVFSSLESTAAWARTYAVAAADDTYWRQEADTFAANLAALYPPSSSSLAVDPWGPYAAAEEAAEAGWVTTTSTSRNAWEGSVADARKTESFDVAEALETRNNRLATAWADREITKAEGRLQTARSSGYDDVLATLAGTRKQPLPRLPDCSPVAPGVTASGDQDAACLPSFSPLNLDAVLADDYAMPGWTNHRLWDEMTATAPLSWVRPVQLAENQVHPVPPPLPGSFIFSSPSPPPPPTDLSASLASSDFPEYYNNVIDLIFGNWDFDHNRHLSGFRPVGTGVDAVFHAYASPPTEATEHLVPASANNGSTSGTTSDDLSPDAGYTGSGSSGGSYANPDGLSPDPTEPPNPDGGNTTDGPSIAWSNEAETSIILPPKHPLVRPQTEQFDAAIQDAVRQAERKSWREILGGAAGPLTPKQGEELGRRIIDVVDAALVEQLRRYVSQLNAEFRVWAARTWMLGMMDIPEGDRNMTPGEFIFRVYLPYQVRYARAQAAQIENARVLPGASPRRPTSDSPGLGYQGILAMRDSAKALEEESRWTRVTIFTDKRERGWKPAPGSYELNGAVNNEHLISLLEAYVKATGRKIHVLYIGGHGYGAGIQYLDSHGDKGFHTYTLTDEQVRSLKALLADNAQVYLFGCATAGGEHKENAQALADRLGRTVWGTNYYVCPCSVAEYSEADPYGMNYVPWWINDMVHWWYEEDLTWDRFDPR